jgi:hypothetical protein
MWLKPRMFCGLFVAAILVQSCSAEKKSAVAPVPPTLSAGVGEQIVEGTGSVSCAQGAAEGMNAAVRVALEDAVRRAVAAYGLENVVSSIDDVVVRHRVDRYWQQGDQCFATVQAVVRTSALQKAAKEETREELRNLGRPLVAFAISSYRIFPNTAVTTRRSAAEVIDSLQQELITRGFDVRRSLKARNVALQGGGEEVVDISSAEREQIATAARHDGVTFLVQGEIKVTDDGQQANGEYLAVVDGSLEAVELATDRVVGSFRDVATGQHVAASAAYTKAISGFARAAAAGLAPQMLDSWKHTD